MHLASWPAFDAALIDPGCPRRWRWSGGWSSWAVRPARERRSGPGSRCRRALIGAAGFAGLPAELRSQIAAELNVRRWLLAAEAGELVDYAVKPNFRALGRRFGARPRRWRPRSPPRRPRRSPTAVLAGGTFR